MTRDQHAENGGMIDICQYFKKSPEKLQGRPSLAKMFEDMLNNCDLVKANLQVQLDDKSAMTAQKHAVRGVLEPLLKRQLNISLGFFEFKNLPGPRKTANDLLDSLRGAQEAELFAIASNFVALLSPHLALSAEFGITEASLKKITEATETFMVLVETMGTEKAQKQLATANIDRLLKANKDLLRNQIDYLMEDFADTDPDCYATYHRLRRFNYVRRHKTEPEQASASTANATVRVIAAADGQPIAGATLAIDGKLLNEVSDAYGELDVEGLSLAQHELAATAPGYATTTQLVQLPNAGEDYTFELELVKTA